MVVSLELAAKAHTEYKKYSAHLFRNGSFWEQKENKDRFQMNTSGHKKLIDNLKRLRDGFAKKQNNIAACNKLIVLSILVKYLEERKDSNDNPALPKSYFKKFDDAVSFCDVLRKRKAIQLFEDLGANINGSIFKLDSKEKDGIRKLDQLWLAKFLDADIEFDKQQYVLWPLYDFNYLPVELISRIYEEFITDRKDIAYTSPCLADFMIDECMPVDRPQTNFKVIDVSCGSGIFLVGAFKRIVEWKQRKQFQETGTIKHPKLRNLKPILRDQIFGVDIESEAVRLAIFSLTIAVCDMLDPMTMWEELNEDQLENLSNNIVDKDFFDFLSINKRKFDLVIGNPPFNPPKKGNYWQTVVEKLELDYDIPDKNIALLFLQQAMKILKDDGLLSLVMPSAPLLYNNTLEHRKAFFLKYNVPQIFDFTRIKLFDTKNYPVAVLFAEKKKPNDKDILHVVVQRTKTSKDRLFFEIDKYDLHYVNKEIAINELLIWKANLLGGGHLFHLIKRMEGIGSLGEYLIEKKDWVVGEGYKIEGKATKKPEKADWITGENRLVTENFIQDQISDEDLEIEECLYFERTCKTIKDIFRSPHLLIKENPDLPVVLSDKYLTFRNEIIGIYSPVKNELIGIHNNIISNKKLYKMLLLSRSGRAGVSRSVSTVLKKDIMALPYSEDPKKLRLSKAEQVICEDVLDYYIDQLREGEKAKINIEDAQKRDLTSYCKTFCTALNSVYGEDDRKFYPLKPIQASSYICTPFVYSDPNRPEEISDEERKQIGAGDLSSLMENDKKESIHYKRIIKHYRQEKNMVLL
jgi:SAM-dependent methyltransferase